MVGRSLYAEIASMLASLTGLILSVRVTDKASRISTLNGARGYFKIAAKVYKTSMAIFLTVQSKF
jgi:hypothetical protein